MGLLELRKSLHIFIDQTDERFLRMAHSMANEYAKNKDVVAYRADKIITKEQLYHELKQAESEIERGDYMTIEEFEKESERWE